MTIEATLLAILAQQRETNDLLRRLLADRAQAHPFGDPRHAVEWTSPVQRGDGGAIRLGWPEQMPPGAGTCGMTGP